MNTFSHLIKKLIEVYNKFIENRSETELILRDDSACFHCFVYYSVYTVHTVYWWTVWAPKITPETAVTFDRKRNEFVWFDEDEEPGLEFRAKPFLELTSDLAGALGALIGELDSLEIARIEQG